jgi:hypothetical protein
MTFGILILSGKIIHRCCVRPPLPDGLSICGMCLVFIGLGLYVRFQEFEKPLCCGLNDYKLSVD